MSTTPNNDLAFVAEQFVHWRANKVGHAKIPNELWDSVLALLTHTKIGAVASTLKLSYAQIRAKLQKHDQSQATENEFVPVNFAPGSSPIKVKSGVDAIPAKIILDNDVNIQCYLSKEMIYTIMTGDG